MRDLRTAMQEDLQMLYEGSAFTILWLMDREKEYESLENYLFGECWLEKPENVMMYKASWKSINDYFKLKGKNRFPEDLNVVMLPLENFGNQIWRLAIIRLQVWARRFDDVINNSR